MDLPPILSAQGDPGALAKILSPDRDERLWPTIWTLNECLQSATKLGDALEDGEMLKITEFAQKLHYQLDEGPLSDWLNRIFESEGWQLLDGNCAPKIFDELMMLELLTQQLIRKLELDKQFKKEFFLDPFMRRELDSFNVDDLARLERILDPEEDQECLSFSQKILARIDWIQMVFERLFENRRMKIPLTDFPSMRECERSYDPRVFSKDPFVHAREIEALTEIRLRHGQNPLWFIDRFYSYSKTSCVSSFKEFCKNAYLDRVHVQEARVAPDHFGEDPNSQAFGNEDTLIQRPSVSDYPRRKKTIGTEWEPWENAIVSFLGDDLVQLAPSAAWAKYEELERIAQIRNLAEFTRIRKKLITRLRDSKKQLLQK